jgi:hypothetical protein
MYTCSITCPPGVLFSGNYLPQTGWGHVVRMLDQCKCKKNID